MQSTIKRNKVDATPVGGHNVSVEPHELELLDEFVRHDSVASLAGAIAERLGGNASDKDLIASADLGTGRRKD